MSEPEPDPTAVLRDAMAGAAARAVREETAKDEPDLDRLAAILAPLEALGIIREGPGDGWEVERVHY